MADHMSLDEIAAKELLNEAKRGAARASVYGALGWQKCPLKPTNKIFLQNMLLSAITLNRQKVSDHIVKNSGVKKKRDVGELERKSKNSVSCEEPSNSHSTPVPSNIQKSGAVNTASKKKKMYLKEEKNAVHHQNQISLPNRQFMRGRSEHLKKFKDNLKTNRKDEKVKEF